MQLTLCENMRAVPYVPFYLALAGEYWRSEGLDVRHVLSPSTSRTATALLDGSVDVSWGGPMRVMMHHDSDPGCQLVCFAQVVARDPFLLVGRARKPAFRWRDLVGLRVAPAGDVPTPWMTFQDDLQRAGLDPTAIAGHRLRPMAVNLRAFLRGAVDVVQVFEPYADRLVSEGRGHVWHRFSERGDISYTTFYATRRVTRARREACRRLVRGMARAQSALFAATPRAIADAVASFLPELSREALTRIVGAYRASGLWARTPDLPPAPYLRLKAALVSGGLIRTDPPYERLVDAALSRADRDGRETQ
jgi:NitT/TauT family transport system substrate-binding protein